MPAKKSARNTAASRKGAAKTPATRGTAGRKKPSPQEAEKAPVRPGKAAGAEMFQPGRLADLADQFRARFWTVPFARADDLLVCDFTFENLKRQGGKLVRHIAGKPATLIVELPPQSFGEQAFLDATGPEVPSNPTGKDAFDETTSEVDKKNVATTAAEELPPMPSARIRMAGRSRIAFSMPAAETKIDFTVDALLDACRRWPMRLNVNAAPDQSELVILDTLWLQNITSSTQWQEATTAWSEALTDGQQLAAPLAAAAKRVAEQAAAAFARGSQANVAAQITKAMQAEVDVLARRHTSLAAGDQRGFALGVMSLMAAQVFAKAQPKFELGKLPFLDVFLAPHPPPRSTTALEMPYRVILSPIPQANWRHTMQPVERNGRTELWHTRLTRNTSGIGADTPAKVRALWSPDYSRTDLVEIVNGELPFLMSLDALDRKMLVQLMTGYGAHDNEGRQYVPKPTRSRRLTLSSLGGLLDVEGSWDQRPAGVGLEQWRHLATMGRDHYVRVVYSGFLCPFGHSASLIKVTERKFEEFTRGNTKGRVAALRQRFFIVVREPVKTFSGAGPIGRSFPFSAVEILTRVTPNLLAPKDSKLSNPGTKIYTKVPVRACFWPMLAANKDFLFEIAATDLAGARVTFEMPLLFVGVEANENDTVIEEVLLRYNEKQEKRTFSLRNAVVCFAPVKPNAEGDPRLPTGNTTLNAARLAVPPSKPRFHPQMEVAEVGIAAIQRLLNKPDAVVQVEYAEAYKASGFGGSNTGEVYLKTREPYKLEFGETQKSDNLGALVTPSMAIQGLSRIMGPVAAKPPSGSQTIEGQLAGVIGNNFNPASFFKGAKILGGVDLAEILGGLPKPLAGANVPKLLSKQLPDRIEARFDWDTVIKDSDAAKLFVPFTGQGEPETKLTMHAVVSSPIAQPSATTFNATAELTNFKVNLFGFITIWFDRLRFISQTGSKPDVAVDLHPGDKAIEFGGPLEFVNELRHIIPSNGFSDPPNLAVTPSGIEASYSLGVPSVTVGIFALENVSIGCGFSLPFDARPVEVRFNFSERQRPFSLTVSMLGGGGFFAIGIGTEGVREIEAALEFGARLSIDLGVASGSVEVKAGVYFHWLEDSVELAGYVRIHGELSVLGLISVSLTFNLQLSYLKDKAAKRSLVWGEATLVVEVEVLCFSADVSVKCRREFAGSPSDPKFIELIPDQATWAAYCNAFAEE